MGQLSRLQVCLVMSGILISGILMNGCFRTGISTDGRAEPARQPDLSQWHHHFAFGAIAGSPLQFAHKCVHGIRYVKTKLSFTNVMLGLFTLGIYYPAQVQVWCHRKAQTSAAQTPRTAPAPRSMSRPSAPR